VHWHVPKEYPETHLETTKDEGLELEIARVGLPREENIDWV
jgi:hypothetical protein